MSFLSSFDKYCQLELQEDVKKTLKPHDEILKYKEDITNADFVKFCKPNEQLELKMSELDEFEKNIASKRCLDYVIKSCFKLKSVLDSGRYK
ncbi:Hypothetical protein BHO_0117600 (plasmid) [Borrelia hermsii YBT]|uniref:Uncharacterized protein n=1 Tax=Borrelia hermsii YBT TaxID=1313295 RepID=W5T777_BORHE|nr:hypothetical protein [Borrelia hermsii]AHH13196.1 Hypothetical protein BHO_0117600 [Borrelia hermsii YBT]